ncbi:hypothetical protein HOLDEFILI_00848 [Holdemania filiformis DSM 12042]|uniref:Uncharacterized protein n=1 Tax=Holdemania filiformis DSM 12042 TaxID=545696 RepID=B9Y4W7_9FIRM|nr:hypothetical protein HOLDEFILI_00848 [Holdemania filiformis DSM 12042]
MQSGAAGVGNTRFFLAANTKASAGGKRTWYNGSDRNRQSSPNFVDSGLEAGS